jgi:predicted transcriptional regulator
LSTEEITKTLQQVFQTLNQLKTTKISDGDTGGGSGIDKPATDPKWSILKNKIICLECGDEFSNYQLNIWLLTT